MKNKYRIIHNRINYSVQILRPWFPIWVRLMDWGGGFHTIQEAEEFIKNHKNRIVKYID